jgi:hypothetical protein
MPSLINLRETSNSSTYEVRAAEFNYSIQLIDAGYKFQSGVTLWGLSWPAGTKAPSISIDRARGEHATSYTAQVGAVGTPEAVGTVQVYQGATGSWTTKVRTHGTAHGEFLHKAAGNGRRTFQSWYAAMAVGLDVLMVPVLAAAREQQLAKRAADQAAHLASKRARDLESVRERAAQGELQRLVDNRARFAAQLAAAARDLNLGQKDTAHGAVFTGRDWERMDSETLSMLRKELEAVTSALHEVQAYTRAIRKFEEDLTEANTDQAIRTMVSLQQARVAGEEVK